MVRNGESRELAFQVPWLRRNADRRDALDELFPGHVL